MQIVVKTLTGKRITIDVEHGGSGSMQEVFKQVRDQTQTPLDQQRLILRGKVLSFWGTLDQYSIAEGDNLHLHLKLAGDESGLRQEASVHLNNPRDGVEICVMLKDQNDDSKRWNYTIGPPYSIDILMGLIQTHQHIPRARQILTYNDVPLQESSTLADYDIQPGRTIYVEKSPRFSGRKSTSTTTAETPATNMRQENIPLTPPPPEAKGSACCIIM